MALSPHTIRYWPVVLFTAAYAAFPATLIAVRAPAESAQRPALPQRATLQPQAEPPRPAQPELRGGLARAIAVGEAPQAAPAPVAFDLLDPRGGASGGGAVEISKVVEINGAEAGEATIRVGRGSTLAIAADALGRMLARAGRGDIAALLDPRQGFVGFEELRRQGIDLRYDLEADRIAISF